MGAAAGGGAEGHVILAARGTNFAPSTDGATSIFSNSFKPLANANATVIAFVGLYGAIAPATHVGGFALPLAPNLRTPTREILLQSGLALRGWLKAQFVSMAVVGVLT